MDLHLTLPNGEQRLAVVGPAERHLKIIRESLGVSIAARDGSVRITGQRHAVSQASAVIERLTDAARRHQPMTRRALLEVIAEVGARQPQSHDPADTGRDSDPAADRSDGHPFTPPPDPDPVVTGELDVYARGRRIRAMTPGQRTYVNAILTHDLTICSGPAGTGKTYLAVAAASALLKRGTIRRLVLVRPAVEAGEKLGFLPGDMQQKVNPFLRPLLDALHDMMDFEQVQRLVACDVIEICPLAFMRGRTLNDAAIILDEAQNTTRSQMLMFLTRMGHGSKMIVTGDTTQIDLQDPADSGLIDACRRLRRLPGVALVALDQADIVRHSLVQRIVEAYAPSDQARPDRR